jgi:DDE family transposase
MTECTQTKFTFQAHFSRQVIGQFDGSTLTCDAGGLLLRETDRRLNLLPRLAQCFLDGRESSRIQHSVAEMISQRVSALALGYEDLNDHEQLRQDPVLKLLAGQEDLEQPLAGKSTLNRLELGAGVPDRYKKITFWKQGIDELLVDVFVEAHAAAPEEIVLDIDTTDVALHGDQEGRFFHGYYDHYCYLPLYLFSGEHLLCARLRCANSDAAAGSLTEIQRIVEQIRRHWPQVRITLRGDSGFCRDELMSWCEDHGVDYVFGLARNPRLRAIVADALAQAARQWEQTRQPARLFVEFSYETVSGSWSRARRVVAKAEHIDGKENPRYVVTSLPAAAWPAQKLYEELYCADDGHALGHCLSADKYGYTIRLGVGRHGESHQGTVHAFRRSGQRRIDPCQSTAAVSIRHGLSAGLRIAPLGTEGNRTGHRPSRHHPSQIAEDWCTGAHHRAPRVDLTAAQLSLA